MTRSRYVAADIYMEDRMLRCSKCGSTEDVDVIEAIGLCAACADHDAKDILMKDLWRSYGWHDRSANT
jgi:hypothetical protein